MYVQQICPYFFLESFLLYILRSNATYIV